MTEILRKLSIKRRMVLFFCLLCLFPILLLLCFSGWSGRYQAENGEQRFTNMYLEQGQNQLNAYLEEYEQKVRYLTETRICWLMSICIMKTAVTGGKPLRPE